MRFFPRLIAAVAVGALLLTGGILLLAPQAHDVVTANTSESEDLDLSALSERSLVFARDGTILATLHAEENRSRVRLADVPQEVIDTMIAIEDEDFYSHGGVNLRASARALFENVSAGEITQGGSTITMQLVKNLALSPERDINRKIREIVLAVRLEQEMSKDEILERYLNTVYFGGGAYGVQAAAEIYWEKGVQELTWPEAALLAALIRNPAGYDPISFPEIALERRQIVLDRLADVGLISETDAAEYGRVPLPDSRKEVLPPPEDYFVEEVKERLLRDERLGATYQERENAVFRGGLRIHTTIDPAAQLLAELTRATVLPEGSDPFTAAIVSVEPSSGAVRVMVGGPGFENYQYNIATAYPGRQTGSSFKTYVLLAALESGYVPADRLSGGGDFPNPGGTPDPYRASGPGGTITSITTASSNGAYVRLGQIVGLDKVAEVARRMGISAPLDPSVVSLPLGVFDVRPIEMASAYGALAYGGIRNEPYLVERVEDRFGNVMFEHEPDPTRGVSRQTACLATEVLEANVRGGTGTRARVAGHDAAGKTGTTDDFSDAWFIGFTPYLSTAVWMGAPDEQVPMSNVGGVTVFGGTYPARMFGEFMSAYHAELSPLEFPDCETTRSGLFLRIGGEPVDEELLLEEECEEGEEGEECEEESTETTTTTVPPTTTTVPPPTTTTVPPTTTLPPPTTLPEQS